MPEILNLYTEKKYKGENPALAETILSKDISSKDIILFDRGLTNKKIFDEITENNNIFISRMNKNYKIKKISEILIKEEEDSDSDLLLTKEVIGHLYTRDNKPSKFLYRIIHFKSKKKKILDEKTKNVAIRRSLRDKHSNKSLEEITNELQNEELIFVTNLLSEETTAKEIAEIYKQRWEIEVFFKFIKQELHFSHLLNRSKNEILSLLYVIMTFSLLVLAYRKLNKLKGYKYVKYRMLLELQDEIYELIIKESGGSLEKWKNTKCEFW